MKIAYLSLGSNVGDRKRNLQNALAELPEPRLQLLRVSSLYETEPCDVRDQPWFYNVVAEFETTLFPMMLLRHVQRIEQKMGRRRISQKGPRIIDIDIALYGNFVVESRELVIPHAAMHERRFVLEPIVELAPNMRHPVFKSTMRELLGTIRGQSVKRLADPIC
jgi:2-amino-4-hydroxy-6-hydroxymethyldihydropteridine diphosphokinase